MLHHPFLFGEIQHKLKRLHAPVFMLMRMRSEEGADTKREWGSVVGDGRRRCGRVEWKGDRGVCERIGRDVRRRH